MGFPGGSVVKKPLVNAGDIGLTPGSGRSPRGGNGNPLLYSCLENPMDRGDCGLSVERGLVEQLDMTEHMQGNKQY